MPGTDSPVQAGLLPWHGSSLVMAMGPRGVRAKKVLLGPWHTAFAACRCLTCGVQHQIALVPLVQDRQRGIRDGVKWGGSGWLAWCRETATVGVPVPLTLSQPSRTLPHHTGKSLGLLPPRADGAARQCHPPCPRGTPHAWLTAPLGTCIPCCIPCPWEGAEGDSPSPAPAGPPGRVTVGRPCTLHRLEQQGGPANPRGAGGRGFPGRMSPILHPPPRPSDVLVPWSAAERAAGPAQEPCRCQACS